MLFKCQLYKYVVINLVIKFVYKTPVLQFAIKTTPLIRPLCLGTNGGLN